MTPHVNRRHHRSDDPLVALHHQLAQTRREGRLDAIVVADESGFVVAGAGGWAACEELAAYAPLLAQGVWSEPGLGKDSRIAELVNDVDVRTVDIEGQLVLVCAQGGERRATTMENATRGIARILACATPGAATTR